LEDRAIDHLLKRFGYHKERILGVSGSINKARKNNNSGELPSAHLKHASDRPFPEYTLKVTSTYGYQGSFIVKGVNYYTNGRKRVSMVICDVQKGPKHYILLVKGDEEVMRDCIVFDDKEISQFKQLMTLYRNAGFKRLVFGWRPLSEENMRLYNNSIEKIAKSKRNQIEEYEKLATSIESSLHFAGCVGVVDNVRSDSAKLISNLQQSMLDMSILSGDSLDSCLNVVRELNFADTNFHDPSDHFNLTANSEKRLKLQIKRIIDDIYFNLKHLHLENKRIFWKSENQDKKSSNNAVGSNQEFYDQEVYLNEHSSMSDKDTTQSSTNHHSSSIKPFKLKKTMLISGQTLDQIRFSRDKELATFLEVIMLFSDKIVGYSLSSDNKVYIIQILKSLGKIVVAVGDGFNDIGMLSNSNAGIQIYTDSVPLITSDVVIKKFGDLLDLYYMISYRLTKNLQAGCLLFIWNNTNYVFTCSIYLFANSNSGLPLQFDNSVILHVCMALDIIVFVMSNRPFTRELLTHVPGFTRDVTIIRHNFINYSVIILGYSLLEAIAINTIIILFLSNDLAINGFTRSNEEVIIITLLVLYINSKIRTFLMNTCITTKICVLNLLPPAVIILFLIIDYSVMQTDVVIYSGLADSFNSQTSWMVFFLCILLPTFFAICVITWFKYTTSYKYLNTTGILSGKQHIQLMKRRHSGSYLKPKVSLLFNQISRSIEKEINVLEGNFADDMISKAKVIGKNALLEGGSILTKLVQIDSISHKMGVTRFLNRIRDPVERKRFTKVYLTNSKGLARILLYMGVILNIIEYIVILAESGTQNLELNTGIPFFICYLSLPIVCTYMWGESLLFDKVLKLSFLLACATAVLLSITNPWFLWKSGQRALGRLIFAPLPLEYIYAVVFGGIIELCKVYE
jgi:magnesium-transporting ATPase (P-type)